MSDPPPENGQPAPAPLDSLCRIAYTRFRNTMKRIHRNLRHLLSISVFGCAVLNCVAAPKGDAPNPASRKSPDWLRRSVVYEIFPRTFSTEPAFNGIPARL